MKFLVYNLLAVTASAAVAHRRQAPSPGAAPAKAPWQLNSDANNGKYGKIPDPNPKTRFELPAAAKTIPASKTVKIRYGPYSIPGQMSRNSKGYGGMLLNFPDRFVEMPCEGCSVIGIRPGLEYLDGKVANVDTNLWLHHIVLYNQGPGRADETCKAVRSLPHLGIGFTSTTSERIFSAGNERSAVSFAGSNAGYMIKSGDRFHLIVDLMNTSNDDKKAYFTLTYDYVEGHPREWSDVRPVWLDVFNCKGSEVTPPTNTGNYSLDFTWTPDFAGKTITAIGHVHDGGQNLVLSQDGKAVCVNKATYGGSPEYRNSPDAVGGAHSQGHKAYGTDITGKDNKPATANPNAVANDQGAKSNAKPAVEHISRMSTCDASTGFSYDLKPGQKWNIKANYDYQRNNGVLDADKSQDDVMGIALLYVKVPQGQATKVG